MARSVIVSTARTPFGRLGGGLGAYKAPELGAIAIRAALERAGLEAGEVEYVIMGEVLQAGVGQAPARQAAIGAGIPKEVGADTINKVCASSIRAVEIADSMIRAGDLDVIVTGGMESMLNAPYLLAKARFGYRLGDGTVIDSMVHDGLTSTFDERHMVEQASFVSRELGISREGQDRWALRSHERAVQAIDEGRFADEIVPVGGFDTDEGPRRDTSLEKLASLKPVLIRGHDHGGERARCEGRRRRGDRHERGVRAQARPRDPGHDRLAGLRCRRLRLPRPHSGESGGNGAREGREDDRRCRASRAERGFLVGRSQLRADARGRRGEGERDRRRGCARPPDRRLGLADPRHDGDARRNGGGLGLAAICSGGGQGDAILLDV